MRKFKFRAFDKDKKLMSIVTMMYHPFWVSGYVTVGYELYEGGV